MTKILIKVWYNPKYIFKSRTQILKDNTPTNLPSNLLSFKQKLLSGNEIVVYR